MWPILEIVICVENFSLSGNINSLCASFPTDTGILNSEQLRFLNLSWFLLVRHSTLNSSFFHCCYIIQKISFPFTRSEFWFSILRIYIELNTYQLYKISTEEFTLLHVTKVKKNKAKFIVIYRCRALEELIYPFRDVFTIFLSIVVFFYCAFICKCI